MGLVSTAKDVRLTRVLAILTRACRGIFQIYRSFEAHLVFLLFRQAYILTCLPGDLLTRPYRKLLTRNVFAMPEKDLKGESKALTKPDILNLVSSDVGQLANFVWTVSSIQELILSAAIGCVFIWHLLGEFLYRPRTTTLSPQVYLLHGASPSVCLPILQRISCLAGSFDCSTSQGARVMSESPPYKRLCRRSRWSRWQVTNATLSIASIRCVIKSSGISTGLVSSASSLLLYIRQLPPWWWSSHSPITL